MYLNYTDLLSRVPHRNISYPAKTPIKLGAVQDTLSLQVIIPKRKEERPKLNLYRHFFPKIPQKGVRSKEEGRGGTHGQWKSLQK